VNPHTLPIDATELHRVELYPPRRRFWDLLPVWFCEWYLSKDWHNPKPTPREVWLISSVLLRAKYKGLVNIVAELARTRSEVERLVEETPAPFFHAADGKKVNPEDLN